MPGHTRPVPPMSPANWARLLALSLLWGGSFFFVEVALTGLPPLSIVFARVSIASLILGAILLARGQALPIQREVILTCLIMGLLNNAIPYLMFAMAQGQISGAFAAILNATTPLFTLIVAHLTTADERINTRKVTGLVFGFAGVVVLLGAAAQGAAGAILMCLSAALSYAFAGVWGRRFRRMGVGPFVATFGQGASASLIILPLWLGIDQPWALPMPGWPVWGALAGLAALCTVAAYLLYFRILAEAGAVNLLLVTFLIPVSATGLGVLILSERLTWAQLAGFGLIALGLSVIDGRLWRRRADTKAF